MAQSRFSQLRLVEQTSALLILSVVTATGCLLVATIIRQPFPCAHDEFSYRLMGETLAKGRLSSPPPPLSEFFDTFHVVQDPVYASKYFPAQGVFLAIGQKLTAHQSVGVWLSSALACAAVTWMLQGWVGWQWGLLGGILFLIQYGVFSYWSQTFWGGMLPTVGGALALGAIRRLWDGISWQNSVWLGSGLVSLRICVSAVFFFMLRDAAISPASSPMSKQSRMRASLGFRAASISLQSSRVNGSWEISTRFSRCWAALAITVSKSALVSTCFL